MKNAACVVAGIFFAILALGSVQLTRLYLQFPLIVGSTPVPLWVNAIAFAATSLLSLWMFISAKKS